MNRMFGCLCCLPFAFAMFKNLMIHRSVSVTLVLLNIFSVTSSFLTGMRFLSLISGNCQKAGCTQLMSAAATIIFIS
jgi:hypothetical protein